MKSGADHSSKKRPRKEKKNTPSPPKSIRRSDRIKCIAQTPFKPPKQRISSSSDSTVKDDKNSSSSSNTPSSSQSLVSDRSSLTEDVSPTDTASDATYVGDLVRRKINLESDSEDEEETHFRTKKMPVKRRILSESAASPVKRPQKKAKNLTKHSRKGKNIKCDEQEEEVCFKSESVLNVDEDSNLSDKRSKISMNENFEVSSDPVHKGSSLEKQNDLVKKSVRSSSSKEKDIHSRNENAKTEGQSKSVERKHFELGIISEDSTLGDTKEKDRVLDPTQLTERTQGKDHGTKENAKKSGEVDKIEHREFVTSENNVTQGVCSNQLVLKSPEKNDKLELDIQNHNAKEEDRDADSDVSNGYDRSLDLPKESKPASRKTKDTLSSRKSNCIKKDKLKPSRQKEKSHEKKLNKKLDHKKVQNSGNSNCTDNSKSSTSHKQFHDKQESEKDNSQQNPDMPGDRELDEKNLLKVEESAPLSTISKTKRARKRTHSKNFDKTGNDENPTSDSETSQNSTVKQYRQDKDKKSVKHKKRESKRNSPSPGSYSSLSKKHYLDEKRSVSKSPVQNSVRPVIKSSISELAPANSDKTEVELNSGKSSDKKEETSSRKRSDSETSQNSSVKQHTTNEHKKSAVHKTVRDKKRETKRNSPGNYSSPSKKNYPDEKRSVSNSPVQNSVCTVDVSCTNELSPAYSEKTEVEISSGKSSDSETTQNSSVKQCRPDEDRKSVPFKTNGHKKRESKINDSNTSRKKYPCEKDSVSNSPVQNSVCTVDVSSTYKQSSAYSEITSGKSSDSETTQNSSAKQYRADEDKKIDSLKTTRHKKRETNRQDSSSPNKKHYPHEKDGVSNFPVQNSVCTVDVSSISKQLPPYSEKTEISCEKRSDEEGKNVALKTIRHKKRETKRHDSSPSKKLYPNEKDSVRNSPDQNSVNNASSISKQASPNSVKTEVEINHGKCSNEEDLHPKQPDGLDNTNCKPNSDEDSLGGYNSDESLFFKSMKHRKYSSQDDCSPSSPENENSNQEVEVQRNPEEIKINKNKLKLKDFSLKPTKKNKPVSSKCKKLHSSKYKRLIKLKNKSPVGNPGKNRSHMNYYATKKLLHVMKNKMLRIKSKSASCSSESMESKEKLQLVSSLSEEKNDENLLKETASAPSLNMSSNIKCTSLELENEEMKISVDETIKRSSDKTVCSDVKTESETTCPEGETLGEKSDLGNGVSDTASDSLSTPILSCPSKSEQSQDLNGPGSCNSDIKNTLDESSLDSELSSKNSDENNSSSQEKDVIGNRKENSDSNEIDFKKSNVNMCEISNNKQRDQEVTNVPNEELIFSDCDNDTEDNESISPQFSPLDEDIDSDSSVAKAADDSKEMSEEQAVSFNYSDINLSCTFSCDESDFIDINYSPALAEPAAGDKDLISDSSSNEGSLDGNEEETHFATLKKKLELKNAEFKKKKRLEMDEIRKKQFASRTINHVQKENGRKQQRKAMRSSSSNQKETASAACKYAFDSPLITDLPIVEAHHKGKSLGGIIGYNDGCDYLKVLQARKYMVHSSRDSNSDVYQAELFKKVLRPLCRDNLLKGFCENELLCTKKHQIRKGCFNHLQMDDLLVILNFVLKLAIKVSDSFMIAIFDFFSFYKAKNKILSVSSYILKWDFTDPNYFKNIWRYLFDALQACGVEKWIAMKTVIEHNFALLSSLPPEKVSKIIDVWDLQSHSLKNVWNIVEQLTEIKGFVFSPSVLTRILNEVMNMNNKDIKRIYKICTQQILALTSTNFTLLNSRLIGDFLRNLREVHLLGEAGKLREKLCKYNGISYGRHSPDMEVKSLKEPSSLRRCKSVDRLDVSSFTKDKSEFKVFEEEKMEAAIKRALQCSNYRSVVFSIISCYKKSFVINLLYSLFKFILNENPLMKIKKMLEILQENSQFEDCKMHFGGLVVTFVVHFATQFQWQEADNFFSLFDEFSIPKYDVKPLSGTSYSPVRIAILYSEIHFYNQRYKEAIGVFIDLKLINPPEDWGLASTSDKDADWINVMVNFLMTELLRLKVTDIATMLFKCLLETQGSFNSPIDLGEYFEPLLYNLFELVEAFPETAIKLYIRVCNKNSNVPLYGLTIRTLLILAYRANRTVTVRELFMKAVEEYAYPIFEEKENTIFLFKSFTEEEMYIYITEWLAWFRKKLHERNTGTAAHEVKVQFKCTDLEDFLENKTLGIPALLQEVDQSIQGAMKRLNKVIKKCHLEFNKVRREMAIIDHVSLKILLDKIRI